MTRLTPEQREELLDEASCCGQICCACSESLVQMVEELIDVHTCICRRGLFRIFWNPNCGVHQNG